MTGLWLKRIVLLALLAGAIGGLAVYNQVTEAAGYDSIVRLANNRKQKDDYARLFDDANFKTITVVFEPTAFDGLLTAMQDYFDRYGTYQDNTMHKVDVVYADGEGEGFTLREVGFRTKSNTSRNKPLTYDWRGRPLYHQTSFQLQFNATFDYPRDTNEYAVLNRREAFNLDQLNFEFCKLVGGELDAAMISEAYAYRLYRDAGLPVSHASFGLVYFQIGATVVAFGFYTLIEPIDQNFISKQFDADVSGQYGDLYKCTDTAGVADLKTDYRAKTGINQDATNVRYSYQLKNNTNDGARTTHDALGSFVGVVNGDRFAAAIPGALDLDLFLRYLAMGFLIGNTDDFRFNANNYYLYFDIYDGPATMIPFDLDSSLGVGKHQDLSGDHGVYYDLFPSGDALSPLVANVLAIPEYRTRYLDYLDDFARNHFSYEAFEAAVLQAQGLYQAVLIADNHLGRQTFDLRDAQWYFTTKAAQTVAKVAVARN